jgi:hypothetical protein
VDNSYGVAGRSTPVLRRSLFDEYYKKRVSKRCGSNEVTCGGGVFSEHLAHFDVCNSLVDWMQSSTSGVQWEPRAYCITKHPLGQCCISWADPVSSVLQGGLASAARKVLDRCRRDADGYSQVVGLTRDTLLGDTCTTQCLSNRPSGCK